MPPEKRPTVRSHLNHYNLPVEVANAPSLYNERDILFCAVSIYQVPDEMEFEQFPLTKPRRSTTDWLRLPVGENIDFGSFAAQALYDGDDCFDREARHIRLQTR